VPSAAGTAPTPPTPPAPPAPPGYPTYPAYPTHPGTPAPGYGYGTPYPQAPRNDSLAVAGLVCGIAAIPLSAFCGLGLVLGTLGLVFGLIAKGRIDRSAGAVTGRGLAIAGAICGGIGLALSLAYWVLIIAVNVGNST
jgi:hypothetical protein